MDPSVSSFRCGASAGRSAGPVLPGSISGGVNTVLAIGCFASERVGHNPNCSSQKSCAILHICVRSYLRSAPDLPSASFPAATSAPRLQKNILQTFTSLRLSLDVVHTSNVSPVFSSSSLSPATIRVWRKLHFCYQEPPQEPKRNECRKHCRKRNLNPSLKR